MVPILDLISKQGNKATQALLGVEEYWKKKNIIKVTEQ